MYTVIHVYRHSTITLQQPRKHPLVVHVSSLYVYNTRSCPRNQNSWFPYRKTSLICTHRCDYIIKTPSDQPNVTCCSQWQLPAASSMTDCIASWPKASVSNIFMGSVNVINGFGILVGDLGYVIVVIGMFYLVKDRHYVDNLITNTIKMLDCHCLGYFVT